MCAGTENIERQTPIAVFFTNSPQYDSDMHANAAVCTDCPQIHDITLRICLQAD